LDRLASSKKTKTRRRPPEVRHSARLRSDYKVLVDLIATIRGEAGKTQQQVADKLGQRQSWYAKNESGERRLDMLEVLDIVDVLGCDPDTFIQRLRRELKKAGY
jgi:ribosome-binding protein aMBF1 (putative translation factor)